MTVNRCGKFSVTVRKGVRGKPKKGKQAKRRQRRMKRACFEDGPRFSGAKHTETGWADGVFLLHAGRKDFFDTLTPACASTQAGAFVFSRSGSLAVHFLLRATVILSLDFLSAKL